MNPQFPLYIPSKGRADSRLTMRALEELGVPYHVIVEEQERASYAAVIDESKLLTLDPEYQRTYDTFDGLGDFGRGRGSGPARNFAWDHSIAAGFSHHWIMDDNIRGWDRLYRNLKIKVADGTCFRVMEDFCLRYKNVAMAGPRYAFFAHQQKGDEPPLILNTRIYSCNFIRNDVPFRWRGRYNEDTDLSLRMLKAGWCTVEFNAFLQLKVATLSIKGGNTDTVYVGGTAKKSGMIVAMHPDVAVLKWKYGRPHHWVNYRPFRGNRLILRDDIEIEAGIDEYGMELKHADGT